MPLRLLVINGADEGRAYALTGDGVRTLGSSHRHADIALNDLYAKRVHCQIKLDGDLVLVTPLENCPTQINGAAIKAEQPLQMGDVLRIGNSHLRLEIGEATEPKEEEEATPIGLAVQEPGFEVVEEEPAAAPVKPVFPRRVRIDELARHTLGHYEIRAALGQGHCGVVFQAKDQKNDQLVALKVLSPDFPQNDEEMQRFVRVMKAALPLRHAHLVSILGAGRSGTHCWIAQEYVEGETVAEVIERIGDGRKIKWKRALHVATQMAQVLEFMQRLRVVHGNITPENILIRKADRDVKLGDLMLAKAMEGSKVYEAIRERKRQVELAYSAPETLSAGATADALTDLYSLGAVTYGLLTGRAPFVGKTPAEIRSQILGSMPEKPRLLQRHIPSDFQAIVLRLLAKRPEERYSTATELLAELQEFGEKEEEE